MSLRGRALGLFGGLLAVFTAVAVAPPLAGLRPHTAHAGTTLILRDGPADPADATDRDQARSVLAGTWAANLAGRFGPADVRSVQTYRAGDGRNRPVVYVSTDPGATVPEALLADVATQQVEALVTGPAVAALPRWAAQHGRPLGWDVGEPIHADPATTGTAANRSAVTYRGTRLDRPPMAGDIPTLLLLDDRASLLATAGLDGGPNRAWAVHQGRLTVLAETPYSGDRPDYGLVFADQLARLIRPNLRPSHSALVRIEDVHPMVDVAALQRQIDVLEKRKVPFSIAVVPIYVEPADRTHSARTVTIDQKPALVDALRRAQQHGATLVLHGVTHQLGTAPNPWTGRTADDYEFVAARTGAGSALELSVPPEETPAWLAERFDEASAVLAAAGLSVPDVFEFPHYAATPLAYSTVANRFAARYERSIYVTDDQNPDLSEGHTITQAFPYPVVDHYGSAVVPENLGYVTGPGVAPATTADDIVAGAKALLAVDQGTASFFYHPFLDPEALGRLVDRITALGYHFATPAEVRAQLPDPTSAPAPAPAGRGPADPLGSASFAAPDPGTRPGRQP